MRRWIGLVILLVSTTAYGQRGGQRNIVELESFTGGKVSPKLEARQKYPKYTTSLRTLDNFIVNTLGSVQRRPGTKFVATAKTGTPRVLSFTYSTDDTYIIEMGDAYMRFYRDGGQILTDAGSVYEIVSPYTSSQLTDVRFAQSDNWMYLVDGNQIPQVLTRTAHNAWTITDIEQEGGPFLNENEDEDSTIASDANTGDVALVATGGVFDDEHVGSLWQISHFLESLTLSGQFGPTTGAGDHNSLTTITIYEGQTYTFTTGGDWFGTVKLQRSYDSEVTWLDVKSFASSGNVNVRYDGIETKEDASYRVVIRDMTFTSHMDRHGEGECNFSVATDPFTKNGIVEITAVSDANNATATVEADFPLASTDATFRWSEGMWSDFRGWPKTVEFHQQRATYGGSDSYPTAIWFSQTGSDFYDDFTAGTLDTDAFWVQIQGQNPIRWLRSGDYLLVGTSGSVGRYGTQGASITPTSPSYLEQSQNGSAAIESIMAGDMVIYIERNQKRVREFGYNFQFDRYTTPDLTLLSEEITEPKVIELAFQGQPQPTIWCVLSDGAIATMTYERNQVVAAWAKQSTVGKFKSIATIPSSGLTPAGDSWTEDQVWFVVERNVDGNDVSYIEQLTPVDWGVDNDYAWFVDGGVGGAGVHSNGIAESPAAGGTYTFTVISENGSVWYVPIGDGELGASFNDGESANDVGGGVVGIPMTGHPFASGDVVRITGTTNYNGQFTLLGGTSANELQITDTWVSETFDGTEVIVKLLASLTAGGGDMVQDDDGNLYYGSNWSAANSSYITKIATDGTLTYDDFTGHGWPTESSSSSQVRGMAITEDNAFLYVVISVPGASERQWLYQFNLDTGAFIWVVFAGYFGGYDMAVDADNNAYVAGVAEGFVGTGDMARFAVADGAKTDYDDSPALYNVIVNDNLGYVATTRNQTVYARTLDNVSGASLFIGSTLGTGATAIIDDLIYLLAGGLIYKIQVDFVGDTIIGLTTLDTETGPTNQLGLYEDLYGNIVIVNQEWTPGVADVIHYYDKDLNFISSIGSMYGAMLKTWDSPAGGAWIAGRAHADGALSTSGSFGVDPNFVALDHLAADIEICVYADGNSIGTFTTETDANGTTVLDVGAGYDVVIAGYNYWSKFETMPLLIPEGRLHSKQITRIHVDLLDGYYLEYSMGEDSVIEDADIVEVADFNDVETSTIVLKKLVFPYGSRQKPTVFIQTDDPTPLGFRAIISEVTSFGPR